MTPVDDRTMNKIRKIQALADRAGTEGEAQAAMNALQNMLNKHGMKTSEITSEQEIEEDVNQLVVDEGGVKQHWKGWLGVIVAKNFRCTVYWSHGTLKNGKWGSKLIFIGLETEVTLAQAAYQSAVLSMLRLRDQHLDYRIDDAKFTGRRWNQQDGKAASKAYIAGFIEGLKASFEENVKQGAIVLYEPEKVKKAVQALGLSSNGTSSANYHGDGAARQAGKTDGLSHGRTERAVKIKSTGQGQIGS